jgi:DNA gyrase subunit B
VSGTSAPKTPRNAKTALTGKTTTSATDRTLAGKDTGPKSAGTYDASSIEVLAGLDAVRKRPGMYIGGTGSAGLSHLLWELIDNAVDEAAAGHARTVSVTLHADGSYEVADDGRGIPVDEVADGRSALEVVFSELHAGGKFSDAAYEAAGGLHGVGASVVNALSTKLVAEVDRDGATWRLAFNQRRGGQFGPKGAFRVGGVEKVGRVPKTRHGTRVRYWPDSDIFDPDAVVEIDAIRARLQRVCYLVPTLAARLVDRRGGGETVEEFRATKGLVDHLAALSDASPVCDVIHLTGSGTFTEKVAQAGGTQELTRTVRVEVALRWVADFEPHVVSYVNTVPTPQGGTHVAGFERALLRTVNDVLLTDVRRLARLAREGKANATRDDVAEGLAAVVRVVVPEPQFRGQTKEELGTPAVQSIVYDTVKTGLVAWVNGGGKKTQIAAVRDKISAAVVARVASRSALETRRRAASVSASGLPDKLADCRRHGPGSELVIVEGDSAAGPVKAGRDAERVAVLPLRGKIVNAGKATFKQVLDNAEAQALIAAIGGGAGRNFDLDAVRYERIVILCDADVDGAHIRCLLLTLLHRHMRPLLDAGRVYVAQPPLFTTKAGGVTYRAWSEAERDAIGAKLARGRKTPVGLEWLRFKGLGEMGVDELAETALDPATRILRQVTVEDAEQAATMIDVLMGTDVAVRRDFLLTHGTLDPDLLDI